MDTKKPDKLDHTIKRLDNALGRLKDVAQGRVYIVGTKISYEGKFGVVTKLHQGSEDPAGSTVDIRLEDGTTVDAVSVTSIALQLFRQ
jgi:hypothetical protein